MVEEGAVVVVRLESVLNGGPLGDGRVNVAVVKFFVENEKQIVASVVVYKLVLHQVLDVRPRTSLVVLFRQTREAEITSSLLLLVYKIGHVLPTNVKI